MSIFVAIPRWQRLLEYLATTADNLVIQLITNDLKRSSSPK